MIGYPGDNYPIMGQSDWKNAPWNEEPPKEVSVTVSITLSNEVKISVSDIDEYSLKEAVKNQIFNNTNFKNWTIDDFEVIL